MTQQATAKWNQIEQWVDIHRAWIIIAKNIAALSLSQSLGKEEPTCHQEVLSDWLIIEQRTGEQLDLVLTEEFVIVNY